MKNIPIPVLTFLAVQLGGAIWWGAQIDHKVKLVEENRRYIQEVVFHLMRLVIVGIIHTIIIG